MDYLKETLSVMAKIMEQKKHAEMFILKEGLWEKYQLELLSEKPSNSTDTCVTKS